MVDMSILGKPAAPFLLLCAVPMVLTLAGCETSSDNSLAGVLPSGNHAHRRRTGGREILSLGRAAPAGDRTL